MDDEKKRLIELLKTLLNINDVEIIKCVIESIIEDIEEKPFKNKE